LLGHFEMFRFRSPVTFGGLQHLVSSFARHDRAFYPCHEIILLKNYNLEIPTENTLRVGHLLFYGSYVGFMQIRALFEVPLSFGFLEVDLMAPVLMGVFDFSCFGHGKTLRRGFMGFHFVAHSYQSLL